MVHAFAVCDPDLTSHTEDKLFHVREILLNTLLSQHCDLLRPAFPFAHMPVTAADTYMSIMPLQIMVQHLWCNSPDLGC